MKTKVKHRKLNKVPVIMQMETLECGAACLAMILAYYDKWIPLEQVRSDCGVSRDGSNAKNMILAARRYGLKATGYRSEPESLKEDGVFPCIIHWNFNHFVVLNGFKKNKAVLNDPARGTVEVSMEEFDSSFTGICIFFELSDDFVPSGKPKSVIAFAKKRLKGAGTAVALAVIMAVISALIGVIQPGFSRVFLDRLLTGQNPEWTVPFIIGLSVISFIKIIVEGINAVYTNRVNGKLATIGNTSFFWKVLRLPMDFFSQRMAGDIYERQGSNATIANSLVKTFAPLALNAAMLVFYLVVMIRYSFLLSMIGITSVLLNLFVSRVISKKRIKITRVQMRDSGKLAGVTVSGVEMIETIKANGAESGFFSRWAGYQASVNAQQVKYARMNQTLGLIPSIVSTLTDTVVLILGVWFVMQGSFTVGMIMAFQGFLSSFLSPAMTLISAGQTLQEMQTEMERVEDVMRYPTDVEEEQGSSDESYKKLAGDITIKNLTFGYSKRDKPVIEGFDLRLRAGDSVAIVGQSGCGKSTISKLISNLYKPWSGEIMFDGLPINQIPHSVFTGSLAVVDQDITIFEDTIENNIKMWDKSIEDFEMIIAARDAQIHEDIMLREKGYQYKLTEGGRDFSGGQRQRLEIARVLAQEPTIVILDEATSALDAKTEAAVIKSIKDRGITCIVIAHRLSTIRDCNEIIVMDQGKVIERGTHDELYAGNGAYTELISNE